MTALASLYRSVLAAAVITACGVATAPAWAARNDAETIARSYLQLHLKQFGLTGGDIREVSLSSIVPGSGAGVSHVYLQQKFRGIPVWNAMLTVNVLGDGRVLAPGNRFVGNLAAKAGSQNARKSGVEAARAAADFLELRVKQPFRVLAKAGGPTQATTVSDGGIASEPVLGELVWYFAQDLRQLRLSWRVQLAERGGSHEWDVFVDAGSGEPLAAVDRIVHDRASSIAAGIGHAGASLVALTGTVVAAPPVPVTPFANIDGSSYTVFPQPYESPSDGGRVVVAGAANPVASPYGWHDTNGLPGVESTRTVGNNVQAYVDADGNNQPDNGSDPDGGATLQFGFPILAGQSPTAYKPAAVTNLFYWNNIVHDIAYNYGFNEASGNFQLNNYGKGGAGTDSVRAEAQDGSGTDNANFSTPVDGQRPRMQMYEWTYPFPNVVTINSPAAIAGNYIATAAAFGPALSASGPRTGALVLVNDGSGTASDACEALVGFPAGAIALLDRGTCSFVIKVKNAQNAGASAVVGLNNVAGDPITMGGTDNTINIPSVMLSLADGNLIRANLPANATVQTNGSPPPNRDSDLDAGVIAHEYGHGISTRLTGGPANSSCLNNAEQMGEGWSDWFGMTLTTRPSDSAGTRRGVGTYLMFQGITAVGIRPTPYSTNMAVDPATYAAVADTVATSSPHGIGYIWNSMLWEVYWNLVHRHGYNPDLYANWSTAGNNLAFQLVMDGLKFQPCSPGFVDGRDAILAADTALTGGANKCEIWRGFAKRGLGASASQGSSADRADGVQAFDLPAACTVAVFGGFQNGLLAAPALNNASTSAVLPIAFSLTGVAGLPLMDTQAVNCQTLAPTGEVPTALSSANGLQQNGSNYAIDWRPSKAWAGMCRAVTLRLPAANDAVVYFRFAEITPQFVKPNR